MIEIEPMNSVVSGKVLHLVALFCGQECKDKLLYDGDEFYKLGGKRVRTLRHFYKINA